MNGTERLRLLLGASLLVGLLAVVLARWSTTTDITHFLPGGEAGARAALARDLASSELLRTSVLWIGAKDAEEAVAVSRTMAAALAADPAVADLAQIEAGPAAGFEEAVWQLYEPRRLAFAAAEPALVQAMLTPAGVAVAIEELQRQLQRPLSTLVSRIAPGDPYLILQRLFDRAMMAAGSGLQLVDGRFVGRDGRSAILLVTSRGGVADGPLQRALQAAIARAFAAVQQQHGGHLQLQQNGAGRHALAAEAAMKADVQRVSLGSLLMLLLLMLLFRPAGRASTRLGAVLARCSVALRLPWSWLPVLALGFLSGTAACLLAFGRVHGLTLAFGASLIGVSIDYAVHFYCHVALAPAGAGLRATLRGLLPSLALGAGTTVLGFLVLLVASFPGLRELALFAAVGLSAALLGSWLCLPGLVAPMQPTALCARLASALVPGTAAAPAPRWRSWLVLLLALVVAALGLPRARFDDGLAALNRIDPVLQAEDERVLAQVARLEQRRMVVAVGDEDEAALVANDAVAGCLGAAVAAGELAGFRSVANWLPSAARQQAVAAAMRADPGLWPRWQQALSARGFVAERFVPFRDCLLAEMPPPLRFADLLASPLQGMVRSFRLPLADGRIAVLTFLDGLRDAAAVAARLAAVPGAALIDIEVELTAAMAAYRSRMVALLSSGLFGILGLLALRYRNLRRLLLAVLPALLASAFTVAVLALAGLAMNLLSLVALLMVFAMGVDYGIFLSAADGDSRARAATAVGVVLSALTTLSGFGLLALSPQPALASIGITAGVGIAVCLLLALSTAKLLARDGPGR